ncbi:9930_t:CDS:1, partial [Funneliformis geosporum]
LCGGIARWIFNPNMKLKDIAKIIRSAVTSIDSRILSYQGQIVEGDELTHKLIHVHTNLPSDNESDPYTETFCYFASERVANLCLEKLKKDDNEKLRKFMNNAQEISEMGSLRGQLFEMICHVILRSGKGFMVRNLLDGSEEIRNFGVLKEEFYDKITEINLSGNSYYRPYSKTSKSVDSYIHLNILFQITVAKRHGIKQKGLKNLENILNKSNEIYLYFAVPKDIFESFTKQNYLDGDKKAVDVENWINEIKQYSLRVDLDQFLISDYHI